MREKTGDMKVGFGSFPDAGTTVPALPKISDELRALARKEMENDRLFLLMRLQVADMLARQNGWSHGTSALEEIDRIIPALGDRLPTNVDRRKGLSAGALLESYLLSATRSKTRIETGKAPPATLSANESMLCLHDEARTKAFLLGIREALDSLATKSGTIHVVDAGCGALPVMGIYAALYSPRARVTAIELNPESRRLAQAVIDGLGLGNRITLIEADARHYVPSTRADLLISETMAAALTGETMVEIFNRQVPNLNPGAHILPSGVIVRAGLVPLRDYETPLGAVSFGEKESPMVSPSWREKLLYLPGDRLPRIRFEFSAVDFPPGEYAVVVGSEVQVGGRTLGIFDSIISSPRRVFGTVHGQPLSVTVPEVGTAPLVHIYYPPGDHARGHIEEGPSGRRPSMQAFHGNVD